MEDFFVELFDTTWQPVDSGLLNLIVDRYSGIAVGGYEDASIDIEGPVDNRLEAMRWMRYYVIIRNMNNTRVWAGIVTRATVNLGGLTIEKSIDDMANRVAVSYSFSDITGINESGTTDWVDDLTSQAKYGIKEILQSEGDLKEDRADSIRDKALNRISKPITLPDVQQGFSSDDQLAGQLTCKGIWATNDWRLWNQPGGVERYDEPGSFEHILGWGLSSNLIGFEQSKDAIHDLYGRLKDLRVDDQIIVSGAGNAANNGTFTILQSASIVDPKNPTTHENYTSNQIYMDPSDDVHDGNKGLGFVQAHEMLKFTGSSAGNDGYWFAKSDLSADHITVDGLTGVFINNETSNTVSIEQGHNIGVTPTTLVRELPSSTVTLVTLGNALKQSFTLTVNVPFTVAEIYIRAKKVGTPSDALRVTIYAADGSGNPTGAPLETVDVLGSALSEDMNWVLFTFSNTLLLNFGTVYVIGVSRTGAVSTTDFYNIDLNEDAGYTGGNLKLWNGSGWVARAWGADAKSASLPFQIWGHEYTTTQIRNILTAKGQFFAGIDLSVVSLLADRLYRDANQTARTEIEDMLKAGIKDGERLLAYVDPDRIVHIYEEPDYLDDKAVLLGNDAVLLDPSGSDWEPGKLPFGMWATLTGIPANVDDLAGVSPMFIERAEYDAKAHKFSALTGKGAPDPWQFSKLL